MSTDEFIHTKPASVAICSITSLSLFLSLSRQRAPLSLIRYHAVAIKAPDFVAEMADCSWSVGTCWRLDFSPPRHWPRTKSRFVARNNGSNADVDIDVEGTPTIKSFADVEQIVPVKRNVEKALLKYLEILYITHTNDILLETCKLFEYQMYETAHCIFIV